MWLSELCEQLPARGHRVHALITPSPESSHEVEDPRGVTVWRPGERDFEPALGEALELHPDAIHISSAASLGTRPIEALSALPVLLDAHDFAPICPAGDLMRRPGRDPCDQHFPFAGCGACAGLLRLREMERRAPLAQAARVVIAHSAFARERLSVALRRDVELMDYGVEIDRFRPDPAPPASLAISALFEHRDRPRVLFLGPPSYARGAWRLVDLMVALRARIPEVELVVAGRDRETPDWDQVFFAEAGGLGLTRAVTVLPTVSRDDLPALYASCRVGIAPVLGEIAGGMFVLQALASGLPVVAHPAGVHAELLGLGGPGVLADSGEVATFADAVASLLADPAAHAGLAARSRLAAIEHHDFARTLVRLERLYLERCAAPRTHSAA